MNRLMKFIAWLTIFSAIGLMIICIYWVVYPYKTVEFTKTPFPVKEKTTQRGGYVFYEVDFCKYTERLPQVSKTFVDGVLYTIPEAVGAKNPTGCHVNLVQTYIPKALVPGDYVIQINYKYKVNPLRTIEIYTETEKFKVE